MQYSYIGRRDKRREKETSKIYSFIRPFDRQLLSVSLVEKKTILRRNEQNPSNQSTVRVAPQES
jgi:hypothetical protein